MDTTVCQDDDATFTCVLFFPSGTPVSPRWFRNGGDFDTMRHMIVDDLTGAMSPAYVSTTIIVNNVTTLDDGTLYDCRFVDNNSNNGTLNVVGEYIVTCMHIYSVSLFYVFNVLHNMYFYICDRICKNYGTFTKLYFIVLLLCTYF